MPYVFSNCITHHRPTTLLLLIIQYWRPASFPERHKSNDKFSDHAATAKFTAIHQLSLQALKPPYSIIRCFQHNGSNWQTSSPQSCRSMFCETWLRQSFPIAHRFAENQPERRFFMRNYERLQSGYTVHPVTFGPNPSPTHGSFSYFISWTLYTLSSKRFSQLLFTYEKC